MGEIFPNRILTVRLPIRYCTRVDFLRHSGIESIDAVVRVTNSVLLEEVGYNESQGIGELAGDNLLRGVPGARRA